MSLRPDSAETAPDPVIVLEGVTKSFGDRRVLDGVDLALPRGASTVIIGGSGTGKSVLLKHMIGLLKPDRGRVLVDGVDLARLGFTELTSFRTRFGMAFQEGALFDSMSVRGNVAFPLKRRGIERQRIDERVAECLEMVGLAEAGDKMPAELSGGMRRRVGFARAIANRPEILLFDEPTTGLDPVTKDTIDELIIALKRRLGSTTVTITHDMESVFRIADRVAMLYEGKIVAFASPADLAGLNVPPLAAFLARGGALSGGK